MKRRSLVKEAAGFGLAAASLAACAAAPLPIHQLDNGTVRARVTEAIGGRLLAFSLAGHPNFLLVDERAGPAPARVDARTGHIDYRGHETWLGPQKQWWSQQTVNPELAAARAAWPPDPYLSLARYTVARKSAREFVVLSPASPVTGVQLRKRYALVDGVPNSLVLEVDAANRRAAPVAWDIWFNTRVPADTQVYVPVAARGDVRAVTGETPGAGPVRYTLEDKLLALANHAPGPGPATREGKLYLQPSHGWMAGFRAGQAFIVQFPLEPRARIHPDAGQVELYYKLSSAAPGAGMLEMEVHAPYRRLAPGAAMNARETWTILPYRGAATRAAHLGFLRTQAARLGLSGLPP